VQFNHELELTQCAAASSFGALDLSATLDRDAARGSAQLNSNSLPLKNAALATDFEPRIALPFATFD